MFQCRGQRLLASKCSKLRTSNEQKHAGTTKEVDLVDEARGNFNFPVEL